VRNRVVSSLSAVSARVGVSIDKTEFMCSVSAASARTQKIKNAAS
jgi:precorrin-6B methylase 1